MSAVIAAPRVPAASNSPIEPKHPEPRPAVASAPASVAAHPTIDQLEQILPLVSKWAGGIASLWTYTVSHGKLIVRLTRPSVKGNLHLTCYDCRWICAPTFWGNTAVHITRDQTPDGLRYVLRDEANKIEIRCGYLTATENVEPIL